jgi:hypothetical protein
MGYDGQRVAKQAMFFFGDITTMPARVFAIVRLQNNMWWCRKECRWIVWYPTNPIPINGFLKISLALDKGFVPQFVVV